MEALKPQPMGSVDRCDATRADADRQLARDIA